ncbi:hypothetical protein D3273_23080 [Lichenibacterium minor]|uniref:Uncharacterized protein n=1 Tax=Lichenibacterium minor TaxID=2316528 RepID=A0A4Q2U1L3_9HYPH|nr:hypothetical protein [Lichenibacterium minor]RYC29588.1 hypothetical protein D3273_23080 [Lichenibacterium minor]
MPVTKTEFWNERRTGGGVGSPDWTRSFFLARDGKDTKLFVLEEWSQHAPGEAQVPGSRRIDLGTFVSSDSPQRESLFGLMQELVN